ncbi:MAG: response regulator, partial [Planctomycetes bacterium]|nr:response regulator [Planctomycetota bacterium]
QDFAYRAQRLETAGRIAGQVAHDFNNLLGPLAACPGIIRKELPEGHSALEFVDFIESAAKQMAEINQQMLTLGRRGHYNLEALNLNRIIEEAIRQIVPRPAKLGIRLDLAEDLLNIKAGRSQIFRVISNLLANARDAMADVGLITVRTENVYADKVFGHIDRISRGEYVKLTVSDTGAGMTPEIMAKMFDPFFTTKSMDKKRGSGLGLSIVHAVVDDHHGHVDCESKQGRGTSFYLFFPTTREAIQAPSASVEGGTESILIVDDDQLQRKVTAQLLSRLGYKVTDVDSGEKAVETLAEAPRDLVILDMIMPGGMDGTETFRRIREILPAQKALIMSGYAESERVLEVLNMGAGRFLRKPLTLQALSQAVREELNRPQKENAGQADR